MKDFLEINLPHFKIIEELIKSNLTSSNPLLHEIINYSYGGKHLRPRLCLLVASCFSKSTIPSEVYEAAAALELIHQATLLHDDIIDNAPLRHFKPSIVARYGLSEALLAGDFLYLRAFGLCKNLDLNCEEQIQKACLALTEGECAERPLYNKKSNINEILKLYIQKTASLFQLACYLGSYLVKADTTIVKEISQFGLNLGIAFQILDDILDVTQDEKQIGKRLGSDLFERKPSLVNVLWITSQDQLAQKLYTPSSGEEEWQSFIPQAIKRIKQLSIIDQAKDIASSYLNNARINLTKACSATTFISPNYRYVLEILLEKMETILK